ncbi:MAG TPA: type II toxin-antitoxin system HicB family antitoxin [Pirellulales bacterium]|nr:type II toxin-antitoxin system HicB family antitoxin [Pirellulales bacterium]
MLVYKSAYTWEEGVCLGEVLDFPGTVSCGQTLDEARANLAGALRDMAETNVLRGEPLPLPDPTRADPQADLEEPVYLVLQTGQQLSLHVAGICPETQHAACRK